MRESVCVIFSVKINLQNVINETSSVIKVLCHYLLHTLATVDVVKVA